jgi:DNA polymerase-3 subunit epsilon
MRDRGPDFVAIDVETANADLSSICQVGVAAFLDGKLCDAWSSLVNPEDYFDDINVSIHGIAERDVRSAPKWRAVHERVKASLERQIAVSHTAFDRAALLRAGTKYTIAPFECRWLDSARVARRAWPMFSQAGYGLASVATYCQIKFKHHDALEDARAAGEILMRAINDSGLSALAWLDRVNQPVDLSTGLPIIRHGRLDGPLHGEVLVFTGALSMPRREAADAAASAGCEVASNVTKHTTLLVVGDQDIRTLAGNEKSHKHRKAEELIANGQQIRIIGESDFLSITAMQPAAH